MKAFDTQVNWFGYELTALMLEDGTKGVALSSIASELLKMETRHTTNIFKLKGVQSLTGYGFGLTDKIIVKLHSSPHVKVTFLPGNLIAPIVAASAMAGNKHAMELIVELAAMNVEALLCDAFGVKFNKEERDAYLTSRMKSKEVRRSFTDSVKAFDDKAGTKSNYGQLTAVFYHITGLHKGRDSYTKKELDHCVWCEEFISRKIDKGFAPEQALKQLKDVA